MSYLYVFGGYGEKDNLKNITSEEVREYVELELELLEKLCISITYSKINSLELLEQMIKEGIIKANEAIKWHKSYKLKILCLNSWDGSYEYGMEYLRELEEVNNDTIKDTIGMIRQKEINKLLDSEKRVLEFHKYKMYINVASIIRGLKNKKDLSENTWKLMSKSPSPNVRVAVAETCEDIQALKNMLGTCNDELAYALLKSRVVNGMGRGDLMGLLKPAMSYVMSTIYDMSAKGSYSSFVDEYKMTEEERYEVVKYANKRGLGSILEKLEPVLYERMKALGSL